MGDNNEETQGRRFAISDIHGCARTFKRLVEEKLQLSKTDDLYLLGDYINRGPDAKGVIDYIFALKGLGYNVFTLRGNHEDVLLDALHDRKKHKRFLKNGGKITLTSFGVNHVDELPEEYLEFFNQTEFYYEVANYLLVHAGFNFKKEDPLEDTRAMMWIRRFKPDKKWLGDRIIVHGHTPEKKKHIKAQFDGKKPPKVINIDSSCVYYPKKGSRLCALNLDTLELTFSKNVEWER